MTDYPDWQTPQAHADKIAITGVPLLAKSTLLVNDPTAAIAASGVRTLGPFSIKQIGYEVDFIVLSNAGSLSPFVAVELTWTDSVTGAIADHDRWVLTGGSASGGAQYVGGGLSRADTVTITITNTDAVFAVTVSTVMAQNSRVYTRDDWRQESFNSPPGFTLPNHQQQSGILGAFNANINAGAAPDRLIALYAGLVTVLFNTNVAKGEFRLIPQDPNMGAWATAIAWKIVLAAQASATAQISLSRGPYVIECANTDAVAGIFDWAVLVSEQAT